MMNLYKYYLHPEQLPAFEEFVSSRSWAGYEIARRLGRRVPEVERIMLDVDGTLGSDVHALVRYAESVIYGPWPEAEPIIMKSPRFAYQYARDVLKGRFIAGEPAIFSDVSYKTLYTYMFGELGDYLNTI